MALALTVARWKLQTHGCPPGTTRLAGSITQDSCSWSYHLSSHVTGKKEHKLETPVTSATVLLTHETIKSHLGDVLKASLYTISKHRLSSPKWPLHWPLHTVHGQAPSWCRHNCLVVLEGTAGCITTWKISSSFSLFGSYGSPQTWPIRKLLNVFPQMDVTANGPCHGSSRKTCRRKVCLGRLPNSSCSSKHSALTSWWRAASIRICLHSTAMAMNAIPHRPAHMLPSHSNTAKKFTYRNSLSVFH